MRDNRLGTSRNSNQRFFHESIVRWFDENGRDFPWRHTPNPYHVLVAEMMLQKTTAAQVERHYYSFINKFPNPQSILEKDINDLQLIMKPLGMHIVKSRRFREIAEVITKKHDGCIPKKKRELMELPGIGPYIANSIRYLVYSEQVPVVDTNVARIFSRFFGIPLKRSNPERDPTIWSLASSLVARGRVRGFNLGLVDFGALVCTKKKPICGSCPLRRKCAYYRCT